MNCGISDSPNNTYCVFRSQLPHHEVRYCGTLATPAIPSTYRGCSRWVRLWRWARCHRCHAPSPAASRGISPHEGQYSFFLGAQRRDRVDTPAGPLGGTGKVEVPSSRRAHTRIPKCLPLGPTFDRRALDIQFSDNDVPQGSSLFLG